MSYSIKQNNKKTSTNPQDTKIESWTPIQAEQIELAENLDRYIGDFHKKILLLSFQPSDRELVILFILNLHPRWRRFVEPAELTFSTWLDAAKSAKSHCQRVSAMLGCEKDDQNAIFKSPKTKTLRDSGYFSPDFNLSDPLDIPLRNLLISPNQRKNIDQSKSLLDLKTSEASVGQMKQEAPKTSKEQPKQGSVNSNKEGVKQEVPKTNIEQPKQEVPKSRKEQPKQGLLNSSSEQVKQEAPKTSKQEAPKTSKQEAPETNKNDNCYSPEEAQRLLSEAFRNAFVEKYTEDIDLVTKKITSGERQTVPAANGADTEFLVPITRKDNSKDVARVPVMREEDVVDGTDRFIENVPEEHKNVNLTFLELTINGEKVKALLAKLRWGSSAISMECAKRLKLPIRISDNYGILTDFGYVDAVGDLDLPIQHPEDPSGVKKNLRVCILPKIYGGKVDLILGADFFFYFNPVLNIQKRTISFFGKETPYIVNQLS